MIDEEMKGTEDYDDEVYADSRSKILDINWQLGKAVDFPKVVTLCGSTRFMDDFIRVQRELTLKGWIVISVGLFGHQEGMDMDGGTKKMLDELHFRKIDLSDAIYVINKEGYIGSSTRNEIEYAKKTGKEIIYMEEAK